MRSCSSFLFIIAFLFSGTLELFAQDKAVYTVKLGDTFFSISRAIGVDVVSLWEANPDIEPDKLKPGQELIIPSQQAEKVAQPPKPQEKAVEGQQRSKQIAEKQTSEKVSVEGFNPRPFNNPLQDLSQVPKDEFKKDSMKMEHVDALIVPKQEKHEELPAKEESLPESKAERLPAKDTAVAVAPHFLHEVEPQQTLFAISRKYGVTVEDLQKWNELKDYNISVGSRLIIKETKTDIKELATEAAAEAPKIVKAKMPENKLQDQLYQTFLEAQSADKKPQSSRASIAWLNTDNSRMTSGYFALHKSAPVGTIIKVSNLVNERFVFVKVIGRLPESADNIGIQSRMSPQARKDLRLAGEKAYVQMEYYIEN